MGIEVALIAATLASNYQNTKNAKAQAKALTQQAGIQAENKAIETKAKAAYQKNSFLSSGFTLEGTPMAVLESTYTTGKKDINQIIAGANAQSKNIMGAARSKALTNLGSMGLTMYAGGMFDNIGMSQGVNAMQKSGVISGSTAYDILEGYDTGYNAAADWWNR